MFDRRSRRCQVCGQPIDEAADSCCTFCGHQLADADVTSDDRTPYALARDAGGRAWAAMCAWVYGAGKQRLTHLGLLRPSHASRRFARINLTIFAAATMLAAFANTGWMPVRRASAMRTGRLLPAGRGWWHIIEGRAETHGDLLGPSTPTDLWWNVPLAVIAAVAAMVVAGLAGLLAIWLVSAGGQSVLVGDHRNAPRLRCAVHYSTAWLHLVSLAMIILVLRPLTTILSTVGWRLAGTGAVCDVPAAVVGLAGVLMWWFWLIRLGETVPRRTRRSVSRFFVLWLPLLVIAILGGAGFGWHAALPRIAAGFNLTW